MSQAAAFRDIDTEEKARAWFWSERFGGKEFVCPECHEENSYWQDVRRPERRHCAVCGAEVRLRADGLIPMPLRRATTRSGRKNCDPVAGRRKCASWAIVEGDPTPSREAVNF